MNRRNLLCAAPALAVVGVSAAVATEDPILPLYREWCAAKAEWYRLSYLPGNGDWEFPESIEAESRADAAFDAIMQTCATTMEGMAALAHVLWIAAGPSARADWPDFSEQCESYECRPMLALWRSATGQDGVPPGFQEYSQPGTQETALRQLS